MEYTNEHILEKIEKKIYKEESKGCWIWTGGISRKQRPTITFGKSSANFDMITVFPHIFLYEIQFGEFSERYLDNTCGENRCVNPLHHSPRTLEVRMENYLVTHDSGCWEWQGHVGPNGYGTTTIDGVSKLVHRLSYEMHKVEIPDGLMVCHQCNNRKCINPDHLYAGTHNDNMQDMANANSVKGEKNGMSILTEENVREIKQHIKDRKIIYRNIADMYGVSRQAIKDIAIGRTWKWVE